LRLTFLVERRSENVDVGQVPELLVEVEAVADEELVRDGEADVADGQIVDEAAVGPVEQRRHGQRPRRPQRERPAEVPQREPCIDDVLDDQDVAAGELDVQVLQEANAGVTARAAVAAVAGELDEVEVVEDRQRPREVRDEDEARFQRADEERLRLGIVARDLGAELDDARPNLRRREVNLAKPVARVARYDAR
jgi:hypothetical protein